MFRLEGVAEDGDGYLWIKGLTGKDIQIDIVGFFDKMGRNIGSLYELYKCVALFITFAEHDDAGRTEGDHVDFLHKGLRKVSDGRLGPQGFGIASSCIHNEVVAPATATFATTLACFSVTHLLRHRKL